MFFSENNVKIYISYEYEEDYILASIKEAYDSTIGENFTGLKLLIWAIPLYICRELYLENSFVFLTFFGGIFGLLLIGFLSESAFNTIDKKPELIPGINLLSMAWTGFKTILAMGLPIAIMYFLGDFLTGLIKIEDPSWKMTADIFVWLFLAALPVSTYIVFIRRLNVFEAFNLKKVFIAYGDAFMTFSYLIVKLYIFAFLIIGFITYMFWLFVGLDNPLINFIWCIAVMYNLTIAANYLAQLSEEVFAFRENENGKKSTH